MDRQIGADRRLRPVWADLPAQHADMLRAQQLLKRHVAMVRIAEQQVALMISKLGRLGQQMHPGRSGQRALAQIEAFEQAQDHQSNTALAVGRALEDLPAAIGRRNRLDPAAPMLAEILELMTAAQIAQQCHEFLGDWSFIEAGPPVARDAAQRGAECRTGKTIAGAGCCAAGQESLRRRRIARQLVLQMHPIGRDARGDEIALLRCFDRRRQDLLQRPRAMRLMDLAPGIDRARNGHGMGRARRNLGEAAPQEAVERVLGRRCARAVEGDGGRAVAAEHQKTVAADPGHRRFDHAEQGNRRQGRIDRVAATPQHVERRQRRLRMRGRDHAVRRQSRRTAAVSVVAVRYHGRISYDRAGAVELTPAGRDEASVASSQPRQRKSWDPDSRQFISF